MKITTIKTTKIHYFAELNAGDTFSTLDGNQCLKIDNDKFNALCLKNYTLCFFQEDERIIPTKAELILEI